MATETSGDRTVAERHAAAISWWLLGSTLVLVVVGWVGLGALGLAGPLRLPLLVVAVVFWFQFLAKVLQQIYARSFLRDFVAANLELAVSVREPAPIDASLVGLGFLHHGSWMVVGADGTVFGGAGSQLYYSAGERTTVYVDSVQTVVTTALSDGRRLCTVSVGLVPHPRTLIQGIKGAGADELLPLHRHGLAVLATQGVVAEEPPGGPRSLHLESSVLDQEWLRNQPLGQAAAAMMTLGDQPLTPLEDGRSPSAA